MLIFVIDRKDFAVLEIRTASLYDLNELYRKQCRFISASAKMKQHCFSAFQ